jgi:hypothetical protein
VSKALEDYVEVGVRIQQFYERYPEGSLQAWREPQLFYVGERTFIAYTAAAYRTPDDPRPGIGIAWEPVPGPTSFTKDSELQNAETSAWGRAIAALGFETKRGIASREEVQARRQEPVLSKETRSQIIGTLGGLSDRYPAPESADSWEDAARKVIWSTWGVNGIGQLSETQGKELLARLREKRRELEAQARAREDWEAGNPYEPERVSKSDFQVPAGKGDPPE